MNTSGAISNAASAAIRRQELDKLEQQLGRPLRDRGVRLDLPAYGGTGFRWLEFWKSSKLWREVVFSSIHSAEYVLTREQAVRLARKAISRSVIVE